jgi:ABC-2 type transport system ATP-binding protein
MPAVELANVTKTFGENKAVDDLSLTVPEASIYGFIGPNGSGKTTTLRMIMNILYPDSGSIRVFDSEAHGSGLSRIGYLPEERGLYKNMKVREVLQFYGRLKSGRDVSDDVDRWLEKLDLTDRASSKVESLSKGLSQKVQFIATVASNPDLVILDEPFTGLDPVNVDVIRNAVLDLRAKGTTVIFSTHDMNVAEKMCDYIFMIFRGKKVLDGTLASVKEQYGRDTIRISVDNGLSSIGELEGIDRVTDFGRIKELHMTQDCDPQAVLARIVSQTRVTSFEVSQPSLHDIFVRIAGPEAEEAVNA